MADQWRIRKARQSDSTKFLGLVKALADFEHLQPPSVAAGRRMIREIFKRRTINLLVAQSRGTLVGYVLYFYTYSSFLAKSTLYIEDLFVLEERRGSGIGRELFLRCVEEAVKRGCGRMEWSVLNWNSKAIRFYEGLGAKRLDQWSVFRLDEKTLNALKR